MHLHYNSADNAEENTENTRMITDTW